MACFRHLWAPRHVNPRIQDNIHKKNQNLYYIYQKIEGRFVTKILKYKLYKVSELEHYIILREKLTV